MTENLAGRGEGLAGLVAQRIKECRDTAKRWKTESRIVRINRAIGKDYANQLDALASLLETALEAAAPASTGPTIPMQHPVGEPFIMLGRATDLLDRAKEAMECDPQRDEVGSDCWIWCHQADLWLKEVAALATLSPQALQCCCKASWLDLDQRDCPIHGEPSNAFSTTSAREQSAATASDRLSASAGSPKHQEWLDVAMEQGCQCGYSDAWHCARKKGITTSLACYCPCHKYISAQLGSPRKVGEDGALRERRLCERITSYLTLGGLFNAELANHDAVSQLLIDCRAALSLSSLPDSSQAGPIEPPHDLSAILEHDRTKVAEGVTAIKKAIHARDWLKEGRGPYEWDDDKWHTEFAAACTEILDALEPLAKIAADWSNCPQKWEDVQAARAQASSEIREALDKLIDAGEDLRYDEYGVVEFPVGHLARKWDDAKDTLVTLLAPSRQGAAKRVEG